ncbi:hypothetical protein AFR_03950 [Actinoplanes friuliensis DSM 7358]|uniref:Uncharacterized protein n=2 Tax=Actinoplanes friuliensis TaxID=196914 RepID=U5VQI8_9ACTN|nr:hypothetical protein AFR_03950 [Actinoplanes friuliensis DSM 7358]
MPTRSATIVIAMTDMTISRSNVSFRGPAWRRRTTGVVLAATLAVAAAFGPGHVLATRLGAGELVGFSTVSAADTITSSDVLAEVPAAGRGRSVSESD